MNAVRVLGTCRVASSVLSAAGGLAHVPELIGVAGIVMFVGNIFAMFGRSA